MFKKIIKPIQLNAWSKYKELSRKEHDLTYLFWECTLNCNFYCKHCGSSAGRKTYNDELKTAEIKKAFFEISKSLDPKKIMIAVTGGEPLLRKDVFEVMEYANKLGFPWGMVTNGYLLNQDIVHKMKQSGMSSVVVSIDGIGKTHDDFRNMPGAYQKAIDAVRLLSEEKFLKSLQITTSVHKKNIFELEEMYKTFLPLGITSWRVMNIDPIGRAEGNKEILLDYKEYKAMLEFIKEKRKKSKIDITYDCAGFLGLDYEKEVRNWFFNCQTGINVASILQNGDIFVCPNVPRRKELIQGNIRKDNFMDVWNNKFKIFRDLDRTKCDKCEKCDSWENCLGNSYHLWDFDKKEPKICHIEVLNS